MLRLAVTQKVIRKYNNYDIIKHIKSGSNVKSFETKLNKHNYDKNYLKDVTLSNIIKNEKRLDNVILCPYSNLLYLVILLSHLARLQ